MNDKLSQFINTIARLRGPDGCPWDKEQDHHSLKRYLLEEAYEVLDAIDSNDPNCLKEELGDLLLQIVLHAQIAKDNNQFDIQNVAEAINNKMVSRHPHVFGDKKLDSAKDVVNQWEKLKAEEANLHNHKKEKSIVDRVPKIFPALLKALKVSEAAVSVGFEWNNEQEVWQQLYSELDELKESIAQKQEKKEIELEIGDILFCLVNLARWYRLNPEDCLSATINKFQKRFAIMENNAHKPLTDLSKPEWAELWRQAKTKS